MSLATPASAPEVSILVPAADEAENLPEFLRQTREVLLPLPYSCEVVVVDDGSTDDTAAVLQRLAAQHAFLRIVTHRARRGIADALKSAADATSSLAPSRGTTTSASCPGSTTACAACCSACGSPT